MTFDLGLYRGYVIEIHFICLNNTKSHRRLHRARPGRAVVWQYPMLHLIRLLLQIYRKAHSLRLLSCGVGAVLTIAC